MELDDRTKLEEEIQQAAIDFGIPRDWAGNFIVRKGANRWFIDIIAPPLPPEDSSLRNCLLVLRKRYEDKILALPF